MCPKEMEVARDSLWFGNTTKVVSLPPNLGRDHLLRAVQGFLDGPKTAEYSETKT